MGSYNEQKEATTNKVRFSINPEGQIEFDAQGLSEWEATEIISQVATQAREQRSAAKKIQEIKLTSEFFMHCLALGFVVVLVTGFSFTISRIISGVFTPEVQNVQR
jgi:uncharacterized protein YoaH (UPF0181 family)